MIIFKNPQKIEIFKSFLEQYGKQINKNDLEDEITIVGINEKHKLFSAVSTIEDPFATNISISPLLITINEPLCEQLKFTKEEKYAMITHEIGHILDKTVRENNNQLNREFNADQFSINLGLSKELKSGLEKIIESGKYEKEVKDINERIKKMT